MGALPVGALGYGAGELPVGALVYGARALMVGALECGMGLPSAEAPRVNKSGTGACGFSLNLCSSQSVRVVASIVEKISAGLINYSCG